MVEMMRKWWSRLNDTSHNLPFFSVAFEIMRKWRSCSLNKKNAIILYIFSWPTDFTKNNFLTSISWFLHVTWLIRCSPDRNYRFAMKYSPIDDERMLYREIPMYFRTWLFCVRSAFLFIEFFSVAVSPFRQHAFVFVFVANIERFACVIVSVALLWCCHDTVGSI